MSLVGEQRRSVCLVRLVELALGEEAVSDAVVCVGLEVFSVGVGPVGASGEVVVEVGERCGVFLVFEVDISESVVGQCLVAEVFAVLDVGVVVACGCGEVAQPVFRLPFPEDGLRVCECGVALGHEFLGASVVSVGECLCAHVVEHLLFGCDDVGRRLLDFVDGLECGRVVLRCEIDLSEVLCHAAGIL